MGKSADIASRLLVIIAAGFLVGALLVVLASLGKPRSVGRRLWTAYATEIGILALVFCPAYLGTGGLSVSLMLVFAVSAHELYGAVQRIGLRPQRMLGIAVGAGAIVVAAVGIPWQTSLALLGAAAVVIVVGLVRCRPARDGSSVRGATALGIIYPGAGLAYLLILSRLDDRFGLVVFLFGLIEVDDSTALLVGSWLGGRKIWPRLSPNKTVVGSVAGLVATITCSNLLAFAVPAPSPVQATASGLLIGIFGQAGDLVASAIKRRAGVKDFSDLVSAQGGLLDIYDALIFTAPPFYVWIQYAARP